MDFAWLQRTLLSAIAANVAFLESAGLAEQIGAVLTFDRCDDNVLALRTGQVLLNIKGLGRLARKQRGLQSLRKCDRLAIRQG